MSQPSSNIPWLAVGGDERNAMKEAAHARRMECLARGLAESRTVDFEAGWLAHRRYAAEHPRFDELPEDLQAVLSDPGIVIRQDAAVFELIARWQRARAATESNPSSPEEES